MLTPAQITQLRAAILAEVDPVFVAFRTQGATGQMAEWLNQASTFVVWKTEVSEQEIQRSTSPEATTWSWPAFIARTIQEQNGWARMFAVGTVNPSLANVRQGFADIFSGSTNSAPAQRTHLQAMCKRFASRGEKIFATGTGTTAAPGLLGFEGKITDYDVIQTVN